MTRTTTSSCARQSSNKPLMRFGSDAGGQRYLVGLS